MRTKIFISYRRQDSGANAIGISQYLEKEFGHKNVYVDVDMLAGTKYPAVIETRLAECQVMLVLIGPDWLTSKDEHGHVRLKKSDDWVRIEIARALKRDLTVIPVLINGAQLPDRDMLPDDIQGLLDHQTASVTLAGFRHEMAGLVRDIRSIKNKRPWRIYLSAVAAVILVLIIAIFAHYFGFYNILTRSPLLLATQKPATTANSQLWKSRPGEWIMFAYDTGPAAYLLNPSTIKTSVDTVSMLTRFALHTAANQWPGAGQGVYEDNQDIIDCKKSVYGVAERAVYDIDGKTLFHFDFGTPETLSLPIASGSILETAKQLTCDATLRAFLLSKPPYKDIHISYLGNSPDGQGNMYYGPITPLSDSKYQFKALVIDKKNDDRPLSDIFDGKFIRGAPPSYRTLAESLELNCTDRNVLAQAMSYYDKDDNLVFIGIGPFKPIHAQPGSIFDTLINVACAKRFGVTERYEGTNNIIYEKQGHAEQKIAITVQRIENHLRLIFQTPNGGQGEGTGELASDGVASVSLHSTTPSCPGSFDGSLTLSGNSISWSYKGQDCGGPMEGHGTANMVLQ
jgi:hypothetical protein